MAQVVRLLARVLGYPETHATTVHLYKDMGSRDLLLRRATDKVKVKQKWTLYI